MPIDGVKGAEMSDYTYRKIIIDRDGVATGEKIVNVPDEVVKQIRADAIDDFRKEICKMITQSENDGNYRFYAAELKQAIADLAEQLKGQKK